jgi:hypothetical protein
MKAYEFALKFRLATAETRPEECVERLGDEGCDDALIGIGQNGRVALNFTREADSAHDAVLSAIAAVRRAIPNATLIEAAPDFVGLTDVADILGCTRQNMRKLMVNCGAAIPAPIHEGRPSIWHLAHVLTWLREQKHYQIQDVLLELAQTTMQINIAVDDQYSDRSLQKKMRSVLA